MWECRIAGLVTGGTYSQESMRFLRSGSGKWSQPFVLLHESSLVSTSAGDSGGERQTEHVCFFRAFEMMTQMHFSQETCLHSPRTFPLALDSWGRTFWKFVKKNFSFNLTCENIVKIIKKCLWQISDKQKSGGNNSHSSARRAGPE